MCGLAKANKNLRCYKSYVVIKVVVLLKLSCFVKVDLFL